MRGMTDPLHAPTFQAFAIAMVLLSVNLLFCWLYSARARVASNVAVNPEDAARFGTQLAEQESAAVARVLRAHANAMALIVPFAMLAWVFVTANGSTTFARIDFGVFVAARFVHSFAYIGEKQPLRTQAFVASLAALVVLLGNVIWMLISA